MARLRWIGVLVSLLVPVSVSAQTSRPAEATLTSSVSLAPCFLRDPANTRSVAAHCGRLRVPESYDEPSGRQISLFVAVVPALRQQAKPDAFTAIAGGPGGASTEDFASWGSQTFAEIRKSRDIVLVDQRGTGRSHRMSCDLDEDDLADRSSEEIAALSRACLATLSGDPRQYTTTVAVRDLEAVRAVLGYEQLNVYGVSYGTRVALEYMRRHPDRVRTVILDGVVPADLALGPSVPLAAQRSLDLLFARCAADEACRARYPTLKGDFQSLLHRLSLQPMEVEFRDPRTGTLDRLEVTDRHLAAVVRLLSYRSEYASIIPLLIDQAMHDDLTPLAAQYTMLVRDLSGTLANAMHAAVICTEDVPFIEASAVDANAVADTYLGPGWVEDLEALCSVWPRGVISDDFKTPVKSDRPVLLLSGEADPVTPPSNGRRAAETLGNARHEIVAGHGHGVVSLECVRRMVETFVATASVSQPDASCLTRETPAPFFVSPSGSQP